MTDPAHAGAPAVDQAMKDLEAFTFGLQDVNLAHIYERLRDALRVSSRSPEPQHDVLPHKYNDRNSCEACHLFWCMSRNQTDGVFEPCECNCDLVPIAETSASRSLETETLPLQAASLFIRDIYEALGKPQPPLDAIVDLPALALEVVGQLEELKALASRASAPTAEQP